MSPTCRPDRELVLKPARPAAQRAVDSLLGRSSRLSGSIRLCVTGKEPNPPQDAGDSADVKRAVAANAGAIGYVGKGSSMRARKSFFLSIAF